MSRSGAALILLVLALACRAPAADSAAPSPFAWRGYYITFMRMPTFGLEAWKHALAGIRKDGGNLLILWLAGGFRSQKFPETWAYNADHANVQHDFVRALVDYGHTLGLKVVLGFTPFGYDGTNQMALRRPEWQATGPDGRPTPRFGIHAWGYNLCPARADVEQFMLDYIRELAFDFYPNADGLFIESSDYAICHCPQCGPQYFDREFAFVRQISREVWSKNPGALVIVYPHYFTGAPTPLAGATAARQPFDPRWTVFFTPHSAAVDAELVRRAAGAIWWDDAPALRGPAEIRAGARRALAAGCTGYVPSLEAFSYVATEPEEGQAYLVGRRQAPCGLGWLPVGKLPYDELPLRVNRIAYREFARDPELPEAAWRTTLGHELFGAAASEQAIDDALFIQQVCAAERTWSQAAPLASPARVEALRAAGQLAADRRESYRQSLKRVRQIERRYRDQGEPFADLHGVAQWLSGQWTPDREMLLAP